MSSYTIVDYYGYDLSPRERMRTIRAAGFDGVILLWADYFDADFRDFPKYAREYGLFVENAHAPYKHSNSIWEVGEAGEEYTSELIGCVTDCARFGIPTLVVHPINGLTPLTDTEREAADLGKSIGINRFARILEVAEKHNVTIAIENQGNPEYIAHVFNNIKSERLKFCFDSGHELFYSPSLDLLSSYGDRLAALHLHDNDGAEDMHMLPFSAKVNWSRIAGHLRKFGYTGAIALETLNKGFEHISAPLELLEIALERAKRLSAIIGGK